MTKGKHKKRTKNSSGKQPTLQTENTHQREWSMANHKKNAFFELTETGLAKWLEDAPGARTRQQREKEKIKKTKQVLITQHLKPAKEDSTKQDSTKERTIDDVIAEFNEEQERSQVKTRRLKRKRSETPEDIIVIVHREDELSESPGGDQQDTQYIENVVEDEEGDTNEEEDYGSIRGTDGETTSMLEEDMRIRQDEEISLMRRRKRNTSLVRSAFKLPPQATSTGNKKCPTNKPIHKLQQDDTDEEGNITEEHSKRGYKYTPYRRKEKEGITDSIIENQIELLASIKKMTNDIKTSHHNFKQNMLEIIQTNNEVMTEDFASKFKTALLAVKRVVNEQLEEDMKEWQDNWVDENETRLFNIETALLANNSKGDNNKKRLEDLELAISHMTGDIDRLNLWEVESAEQKAKEEKVEKKKKQEAEDHNRRMEEIEQWAESTLKEINIQERHRRSYNLRFYNIPRYNLREDTRHELASFILRYNLIPELNDINSIMAEIEQAFRTGPTVNGIGQHILATFHSRPIRSRILTASRYTSTATEIRPVYCSEDLTKRDQERRNRMNEYKKAAMRYGITASLYDGKLFIGHREVSDEELRRSNDAMAIEKVMQEARLMAYNTQKVEQHQSNEAQTITNPIHYQARNMDYREQATQYRTQQVKQHQSNEAQTITDPNYYHTTNMDYGNQATQYHLRREKVHRPTISQIRTDNTQKIHAIPTSQKANSRTTCSIERESEGRTTECMREEYESNYPSLKSNDPIRRILDRVIEYENKKKGVKKDGTTYTRTTQKNIAPPNNTGPTVLQPKQQRTIFNRAVARVNGADHIEAYQTLENDIISLPTAELSENPYYLGVGDYEIDDYV